MFWSKKSGKDTSKTPTKAELIKETQENMRVARDAIGEENIKKMAEALHGKAEPKKPLTPREQAIKLITESDQYKVADNILAMLRDKSH